MDFPPPSSTALNREMSAGKKSTYLVSVVFFLSGCSALVFETVWFRITSVVLGSSIWSAAAVLMAFMAGLGLGNLFMALRGGSITRPLRVYVIVEIAIGLSGVVAIYLLPVTSSIIAKWLATFTGHGGLLNFIRFTVAFAVLLVPSTAMGMTIPLLQKFLHNQDYEQDFSYSLGSLYGFNTLGAVLGTLIAEFTLIGWVGLKGSGQFALLINLIVVLILLRAYSKSVSRPVGENATSPGKLLELKADLLPPFLAGFALLALEVIWFRYMLLVLGGTSAIFALMLAIVLSGIGIGGIVASKTSNNENIRSYTLFLPLVSAVTLVLSFYCFNMVFTHFYVDMVTKLFIFTLSAILLMLPTCILSGMLFTFLGGSLYKRLNHTTQATGVLTFTNTMGAALGSGVATFVFLPKMGVENSLLLLGLIYLLISFFVYQNQKVSKPIFRFYVPLVAATIALFIIFPFGALEGSYHTFSRSRLPNERLFLVKEGLNQTIQYYKSEKFGEPLYYRLVTNSYSMSTNKFSAKRYMKLYVYFPFLFNRNIEDVLQISYGIGNTAEAVTNLGSVKRFDIVDISKDILDTSRLVGAHKSPLDDERAMIHIEDGRFFLQTATLKYDLITGEPPPPKHAGIVNLYSKEFFEVIFKHLKPKGMFTYWLPAHSLYDTDALAIIKSFCLVFEDCSLWNGSGLDFMLVGSRDGIKHISVESFRGAWESELGKELRLIGLESPALLGTTYIADNRFLLDLTKATQPVTDNYPHRISPSKKGIHNYSMLYAGLLDIERRTRDFGDSNYIRRLFPEEIVGETLQYFWYEGALLAKFGVQYSKKRGLDWELLTNILTKTDFKVLPLLLLDSDPQEQMIVAQLETQPNSKLVNSQEYQLAYIKNLVAHRKYNEAVSRLEDYFNKYPVDKNRTRYVNTIQLLLLAKALAGDITAEYLQSIANSTNQPLHKGFAEWFVRRFFQTSDP